MGDALGVLTGFGVPVETVIDVGVQRQTPVLMRAFPRAKHVLIEPIEDYHGKIEEKYSGIDHVLHGVAVSDQDGWGYQVGVCMNGSGKVTHSYFSDLPVQDDPMGEIIHTRRIRKTTVDNLLQGSGLPTPMLLKIDIDGQEARVIKGASRALQDISIVVVESNLASLTTVATLLEAQDFSLVDIVDNAYYYRMLSQVDLIFVRNDYRNEIAELRPWETKPTDLTNFKLLKHHFHKRKRRSRIRRYFRL